LRKLGYAVVRQSRSHLRLSTELPRQHHLTIPAAPPLKIGMIAAIIKDVAAHHKITVEELVKCLFPHIQASDHSIDCPVPRRVNLRLCNRIEMLLLDLRLRWRIDDNFSLLMTEAHMQETSSDPSQLLLIAVSTVAVLF
jgi:predicted RNA binding protein YcfA (HicA-like mRNA interferase family)